MSNMNIEHEWDEDGNCRFVATATTPNYRWKWLDIFGIFLSTIAGYFGVTSQGFQSVAKECFAASEYERIRHEEDRVAFAQEQARAEMAGTLEGLVYFDGIDVP